jgi:signal transduction histidine kinase
MSCQPLPFETFVLGLALDSSARIHIVQVGQVLLRHRERLDPGGGEVTLRTNAVDHQAQLIVEDSGVGIPPADLERIGERFYRGDPDQTGGADGTGLGLAIAFRIAAAHGGKIELGSQPGHGTRAIPSLSASDQRD